MACMGWKSLKFVMSLVHVQTDSHQRTGRVGFLLTINADKIHIFLQFGCKESSGRGGRIMGLAFKDFIHTHTYKNPFIVVLTEHCSLQD